MLDAVANTVLDHPLLQVGINSAKKPAWVRLQRILLREHIIWSQSTPSRDAIALAESTCIDDKFDNRESRPGWRVSASCAPDLTYVDVGFIWSHDISDGIGGKIVQETILYHLNAGGRVEGLSDDGILLLPDASLPPAPETVCKYPVTPMFLLGQFWKEYCPGFIHPHRQTMATWAPITQSSRKTTSRSISIDNAALQRILSQSRNNKTTLTGVLHAMTLLSLASRIPAETSPGFVAETALDLRKLFKPLPNRTFDASNTICNMVSSIEHRFNPKYVSGLRKRLSTDEITTLLWPIAHRFRSEIAASLDMGNANKVNGLMKFVSDWKDQMENHAARERTFSWSVSNLGVLSNKDAKSWRFKKAEFRLSMETAGAAIHVDAVSVDDGNLGVMVNWQDGVVDDDIGNGLAGDIEKWLRSMK